MLELLAGSEETDPVSPKGSLGHAHHKGHWAGATSKECCIALSPRKDLEPPSPQPRLRLRPRVQEGSPLTLRRRNCPQPKCVSAGQSYISWTVDIYKHRTICKSRKIYLLSHLLGHQTHIWIHGKQLEKQLLHFWRVRNQQDSLHHSLPAPEQLHHQILLRSLEAQALRHVKPKVGGPYKQSRRNARAPRKRTFEIESIQIFLLEHRLQALTLKMVIYQEPCSLAGRIIKLRVKATTRNRNRTIKISSTSTFALSSKCPSKIDCGPNQQARLADKAIQLPTIKVIPKKSRWKNPLIWDKYTQIRLWSSVAFEPISEINDLTWTPIWGELFNDNRKTFDQEEVNWEKRITVPWPVRSISSTVLQGSLRKWYFFSWRSQRIQAAYLVWNCAKTIVLQNKLATNSFNKEKILWGSGQYAYLWIW